MSQTHVSKQTQFKASRAHPRVDAGFVVRLIRGAETIMALAADVSMVGLSIDAPLEQGADYPLAISLPGEKLTIYTLGRVERSNARGSALTFVDLSWDSLFALARYLSPRL